MQRTVIEDMLFLFNLSGLLLVLNVLYVLNPLLLLLPLLFLRLTASLI